MGTLEVVVSGGRSEFDEGWKVCGYFGGCGERWKVSELSEPVCVSRLTAAAASG